MRQSHLDALIKASSTRPATFGLRSTRMTIPNADDLLVREFQPEDGPAFRAINEAWITHLFVLEQKDHEALNNPQASILAKGGRIFMAVRGGRAVGCCGLLPMGPGQYEVTKMGVLKDQRGRGTGRILLQTVVDWARDAGAHRLYLETNHQLKPAIHLYHALGFRDLPPERVTPSPYARADVYMELLLTRDAAAPTLEETREHAETAR